MFSRYIKYFDIETGGKTKYVRWVLIIYLRVIVDDLMYVFIGSRGRINKNIKYVHRIQIIFDFKATFNASLYWFYSLHVIFSVTVN